jgi:hypothetical protein
MQQLQKEVPVNEAFAQPVRINWLQPGEDPNKPTTPRPTIFPTYWKPHPEQRIIGPPYKEQRAAPWLYGETPNLERLVGNAILGYGA